MARNRHDLTLLLVCVMKQIFIFFNLVPRDQFSSVMRFLAPPPNDFTVAADETVLDYFCIQYGRLWYTFIVQLVHCLLVMKLKVIFTAGS